MGGKLRVFVEIFHRGELSQGQYNRNLLGQAIYHWAILVRPKGNRHIGKSTSFDVSDAPIVTPTGVDPNAAHRWRFQHRPNVNPLSSRRFLGAIMIGKVPKRTGIDGVRKVLTNVPLPLPDRMDDNTCVTWTREAIVALQDAHCAERFDVDELMAAVVRMGDETLRRGRTNECFTNFTQRPM